MYQINFLAFFLSLSISYGTKTNERKEIDGKDQRYDIDEKICFVRLVFFFSLSKLVTFTRV